MTSVTITNGCYCIVITDRPGVIKTTRCAMRHSRATSLCDLCSPPKAVVVILIAMLVDPAVSSLHGTTLRLPTVFASSMVLPYDAVVPFHGWASPLSSISVIVGTSPPLTTTASADGTWHVDIPPMSPSLVEQTIKIAAGAAEHIVLTKVLVGAVYICSGQSNMQLPVSQTLNGTAEALMSERYAGRMRIFQVAMLPSYGNVTTPQTDVTPNVPWGEPTAARTAGFSALCYYHAKNVADAHPNIPVGVVASSWGGTTIQPWMSAAAVAKCGATTGTSLGTPDFSPYPLHAPGSDLGDAAPPPSMPGTLWNAMLAPLLPLKPAAWIWYQGESNSGAPQQYQCLLRGLITQWRAAWPQPHDPSVEPIPFIVIGLAPWPAFDIGMITGLRYAQEQVAHALPKVGLVVAADVGDPSGANHPIHPPWKQEVARRSALLGEALVFHNRTVPPTGPRVVSAVWDRFETSWGAFHFDSNPGGSFCNSTYASSHGWICSGIRLTFDRAVKLSNLDCTARGFSMGASHAGCGALGSSGGFEVWNSVDGDSTHGTLGPTGETLASPLCTDCKRCPCMQPAEVWGLLPGSADRVLQLNMTWIMGGGPGSSKRPVRLRYGWRDYPSMSVFSKEDGRPAAPFNITLA